MMKVFFASIHPAPYIDSWLRNISNVCDLIVAYNYKKSAAKTWKNYEPFPGVCYEEIGALSWIKIMLKCDYIILGGWHERINIISLIVAKIFGKKLAAFSDHPYEVKKHSLSWWKKKLILFFVPNILCATHSTIKYYQDIFGYQNKNLFFFPYAFEQNIPNLTAYNTERVKLLSAGAKIKMFVANNFRERKGYKCLYEALQMIKQQGLIDRFEITIAGSGEEFGHYSKLLFELSKDIKLLGWINNEDYLKLMADTDIFVHASMFEPFSIPPIDALKRGKLLIASDGVKSTELLLKNGTNGFCFKAGNPAELASVLSEISLDVSLVYHCGMAGKIAVDELYNNQVYADTIKKAIYG